ncbi:MAG: hypothetical protein GYB64_00805 [Chloroflexi bacterium]|nr:hypothetical protein [Chloroflexota bacterium]
MSNEPNAGTVVAVGLGKGCLAGLGLAVLFLVVSALTYALLGLFDLPVNIRLLLTFLSGPVLGTVGVIIVLYMRSLANQQNFDPKPLPDDETADWD